MRIKCKIPQELKGLVSVIQRKCGDCEGWLKAYNKSPYRFTWFGHRMIVDLLYCSYGVIGYSINYRGYNIVVDNDLNKIDIE